VRSTQDRAAPAGRSTLARTFSSVGRKEAAIRR
jgi:hypothetical protein